jgi:HD-GYP domain-containing protein (c-di-GMP phosphodiesterase class II)
VDFRPEPEPPVETGPAPAPEAEARPRILDLRDVPCPPAYETALALVQRIFAARDLRSEVDLGEVRYALYDLLELLREQPEAILPEVFRPESENWFERHHVNVATLALLTGDLMKSSLSEVVDLGTAALFHDIGMLTARETWDADMKLPPKVFEQAVRPHPELGFRRLQEVSGMTGAIDRIVLEEHERLDGTGYPEGLSGEAIHPGARILGVCDTLEALTHPRPFRDHLAPMEALERIKILAQYTLDPAVVDALSGGLTELLEHGAREPEPR